MQATIITIGDEILIGQIVDTNSAWMGIELNLLGIQIREIISISDDHQQITETVDHAMKNSDLILVTGGLGPTKDDITKQALAEYFKVEMAFHEPTWKWIQAIFEKLGRTTTPAHKDQCFLPKGISVLKNELGTAPGMLFERDNKILISMPGVPHEMKYIMSNGVMEFLKPRLSDQVLVHRTILTAGDGESRIAARLEDIENNLPDEVKLAYLPGLGQVRLRISGKGTNKTQLVTKIEEIKTQIVKRLGPLVFGYEKQTLSGAVGQLLNDKGLKLATAESCTGGYIGHLITKVPGSSAYFNGGIIAYSNEVKTNFLKVKQQTLDDFGAVSEQTVTEMVHGTLEIAKVDVAIAISGVAGPGGGFNEKPVGTIWIAVGNRSMVQTRKLNLFKDRLKNIEYSGSAALNLLRRFLLEVK